MPIKDLAIQLDAMMALAKQEGFVYDGTKWVPASEDTLASGQIVKTDDDKNLVFGWANIAVNKSGQVLVDRQGDFIDDPWELEKAAYDYMLHARDGGEVHLSKGVATCVESMVFTPEKIAAMGITEGILPQAGWWAGFKVHKDDVYKGVRDGYYAMFSIHGGGLRKETDLAAINHIAASS